MEADTIVFVGNALVDFAVKIDEKLLAKYDLVVDNQYECSESQVVLFDDISKMDNVKVPGGSAQNSARICASISRKDNRFSANVFMIGSIGDDENGRYLTNSLKSTGVIPLYHYSELPTGTTAALITDDESRTLVANIAASSDLNAKVLLNEEVHKALTKSGIIFVEGYILTKCSEVAFKLAEFASSNNRVFTFGISAVFVARERFSDLKKLLPSVDILFGNLQEAKELAKHLNGINTDKLLREEIIENILKLSLKTKGIPSIKGVNQLLIVTNGSKAVTLGKLLSCGNVVVESFPVAQVNVTGDTIGAGDTFVAGVLMSLLKKFTIEEAIAMGNKYSSFCLKHTGCFID